MHFKVGTIVCSIRNVVFRCRWLTTRRMLLQVKQQWHEQEDATLTSFQRNVAETTQACTSNTQRIHNRNTIISPSPLAYKNKPGENNLSYSDKSRKCVCVNERSRAVIWNELCFRGHSIPKAGDTGTAVPLTWLRPSCMLPCSSGWWVGNMHWRKQRQNVPRKWPINQQRDCRGPKSTHTYLHVT